MDDDGSLRGDVAGEKGRAISSLKCDLGVKKKEMIGSDEMRGEVWNFVLIRTPSHSFLIQP